MVVALPVAVDPKSAWRRNAPRARDPDEVTFARIPLPITIDPLSTGVGRVDPRPLDDRGGGLLGDSFGFLGFRWRQKRLVQRAFGQNSDRLEGILIGLAGAEIDRGQLSRPREPRAVIGRGSLSQRLNNIRRACLAEGGGIKPSPYHQGSDQENVAATHGTLSALRELMIEGTRSSRECSRGVTIIYERRATRDEFASRNSLGFHGLLVSRLKSAHSPPFVSLNEHCTRHAKV